MSLRYVPTRQRDRYRVFDGRTFLGLVERPRLGKLHRRLQMWCVVIDEHNRRRWHQQCYGTRTEAAEALRDTRQDAG